MEDFHCASRLFFFWRRCALTQLTATAEPNPGNASLVGWQRGLGPKKYWVQKSGYFGRSANARGLDLIRRSTTVGAKVELLDEDKCRRDGIRRCSRRSASLMIYAFVRMNSGIRGSPGGRTGRHCFCGSGYGARDVSTVACKCASIVPVQLTRIDTTCCHMTTGCSALEVSAAEEAFLN